jgi:TIR domain
MYDLNRVMLYDVFISHASEDKDGFVRLLAGQLKERRIEVWYEEFSLRPGDSLRQSIDQGLSKSRYGS